MGKPWGFVSTRMPVFNDEVKTIRENKKQRKKKKKHEIQNHLLEPSTRVTLYRQIRVVVIVIFFLPQVFCVYNNRRAQIGGQCAGHNTISE